MTKVVLHGELGLAVGRSEWRLDVASPAEALRAIEANTGKLFRYLAEEGEGFSMYRVLVGGKDISEAGDLTIPVHSERTFDFIPVPSGAANQGIWTAIAGVALIVVGVLLSWATLGSSFSLSAAGAGLMTGEAGFFAMFAFSMGVSLTLGGIAQMLTPTPKNEEPAEDAVHRPSALFNGATNTTRQGNPVAIGYGEVICGSQVISSGIRATDLPTVTFWSVSVVYVQNAEVQYNSRYYSSKVNNNLGHYPPAYPILSDAFWLDSTDES